MDKSVDWTRLAIAVQDGNSEAADQLLPEVVRRAVVNRDLWVPKGCLLTRQQIALDVAAHLWEALAVNRSYRADLGAFWPWAMVVIAHHWQRLTTNKVSRALGGMSWQPRQDSENITPQSVYASIMDTRVRQAVASPDELRTIADPMIGPSAIAEVREETHHLYRTMALALRPAWFVALVGEASEAVVDSDIASFLTPSSATVRSWRHRARALGSAAERVGYHLSSAPGRPRANRVESVRELMVYTAICLHLFLADQEIERKVTGMIDSLRHHWNIKIGDGCICWEPVRDGVVTELDHYCLGGYDSYRPQMLLWNSSSCHSAAHDLMWHVDKGVVHFPLYLGGVTSA